MFIKDFIIRNGRAQAIIFNDDCTFNCCVNLGVTEMNTLANELLNRVRDEGVGECNESFTTRYAHNGYMSI